MIKLLPALLALFVLAGCFRHSGFENDKEESPSRAGEAFQFWDMARTFPDGHFYTEKYTEGLAQMRLEAQLRGDRNNTWEAIGPENIGGRTLCLAINPLDTNILWAGSASGGLWKSVTGGRGAHAWVRVETGFPVLGVSAIAINPGNPQVMYIGTGEVYNVENSAPNVAFRTTRGTYGIGILKSTDGGVTWSKSLDWSYGQLRGVQDIKINPKRPATVFAATTEGLLRSRDAGASWQTVHNKRMAVDIEINPQDTTKIFVTHGSLDDEDVSGIYRSTDGGGSFQKLGGGLPASYSGKALLTIFQAQPDIMYASVGNSFTQEGLYKTVNGGANWSKMSSQDVCTYQGWYSHDVVIKPTNQNTIIWVGIDAWKSTDGGSSIVQKSYWYHWFFGQVPAGEQEGAFDYVHADIHRAYWLENDPNKLYVVTDGGIFVSYDSGESWDGRNGGYQTQQFYANFSNSATNPLLAIGGMQDNATAIYTGDPAWTRVIGGDGECTAINPANDLVMYGSSQYLNMLRSNDGGENFDGIGSSEMSDESPCFNGPFEIVPSDPNSLYAGAQSLYRSNDAGDNWFNVSGGYLAGGDAILTMAVHPVDPGIVFCSTVPSVTNAARVFRFKDGIATQMNGLPNRICMDIAIDPVTPNTVYAVFAGFNTQHVWRSSNNGTNWTAIDNGLPDVPTNTILIDPLQPAHIYIGNDLGVWLSKDAGASWELYSADAPQAMLTMNLSISADRKLRVATYGLGVWQTQMAFTPVGTNDPLATVSMETLRPNPASDAVTLSFTLSKEEQIAIKVLDINGKCLINLPPERQSSGKHSRRLDLSTLPAGTYGVVLEAAHGSHAGKLLVKL